MCVSVPLCVCVLSIVTLYTVLYVPVLIIAMCLCFIIVILFAVLQVPVLYKCNLLSM